MSPSSSPVKTSELLVKALEGEGVRYVFGVPGEENLDFLEALRTSTIEFVLTRHEQAGAFMAATYGRLTGRAGVCLATLGPGAANLVTGAAYAQLGAMPMVMITGQKPITRSKQGRFQIVDVVSMMRPLTKFTRQIVHGNTVPALVRECFRLSEEERPGPVHLELPEDIAGEVVEDWHLIPRRAPCLSCASRASVAKAAEMIEAASSPLLLIGAGTNRKQVIEPLRAFVEKTGIPFFNTQMGKGVIGGAHPLYIGTAALSDNDYLHCAIDRADLVINAGHDVVEKPPFFMRPGGKTVIHVNYSPAEVDTVYFPQHDVVGDIGNSFSRLTERLSRTDHHDFSYFMKIRQEVLGHMAMDADSNRFPLLPQRVVADVRKVLPADGIVALDNGIFKIWFARNYRTNRDNTILLDNALATMGAGLPSAMVAAMLKPDRRVMAVCGDGGFMMNSQEMETAVRLGLNLVVLVLRDNSYGMIRWKQAMDGYADWGLEYGNPDFVLYGKAYGAGGHRVESADSFLPLMERCFEEGGVHLIDVPVDYSENQRVLINELAARVCLL
ncbi:acetolactate synthase large subunit [Desulfoluna spongiiphila]|uniref:acetolactate synthase large subunit n=1 Tax=Desulfoluna spongiiphila TaxID=419481 RepID=UPI001258A9F2|nr:acetolactate synthase large subunit [Desulfoluna spongiiphila]VVS90922.1 thiamin diphosphate-binding fold [Desulfoluna spongiiphila]